MAIDHSLSKPEENKTHTQNKQANNNNNKIAIVFFFFFSLLFHLETHFLFTSPHLYTKGTAKSLSLPL